MAKKIMLKSEYADYRGVSRPAITRAIKIGRIKARPDGRINVAEANRMMKENTQGHRALAAQTSYEKRKKQSGATIKTPQKESFKDGESWTEARTRHEKIKAKTAQLNLETLKTTLIDRAEAFNLFFTYAQTERESWLSFSSRYATEIAAEVGVDVVKLQIALDTAIKAHLDEIAETISAEEFTESKLTEH